MADVSVADHLAIHELFGRYSHAVDRQDFELARSCYHEDAYDDHGRYKGDLSGLITFFHELGGTLASTFHMMGIPYVTLRDDRAWVITYALYRRQARGAGEAVMQGLRYLDYLERREDRWGIVRRTVVLDWEQALTQAPEIPSSPEWERGAYGEDDPATAFLREASRAGS